MSDSILNLTDDELHDFVNETLKYCSGVVHDNLFNGDDGLEYSVHAIDIMHAISEVVYPDFNIGATRALFHKWFAAELDSDDHPQMNWSYLAIPPVWDEYIVNKDEE
jgi:hypothetical protein